MNPTDSTRPKLLFGSLDSLRHFFRGFDVIHFDVDYTDPDAYTLIDILKGIQIVCWPVRQFQNNMIRVQSV